MTYRPKVSRDAASLFTPAQADAIESLELDDEKDAPMAERLLAMLGITLEPAHAPECCQDCGAPFNDADATPSGLCAACEGEGFAEAEHIRRQEHADYERSRGVL